MYRECLSCGSTKTYVDKTGRHHWRIVEKGYFCNKCYLKHYTNKHRNPEITKKWHDLTNTRKIRFLGKRFTLSWDFRKYVCEWCNTPYFLCDIHHLKYIPCMPWACTVELCKKCHSSTKRWRNQYTRKKD